MKPPERIISSSTGRDSHRNISTGDRTQTQALRTEESIAFVPVGRGEIVERRPQSRSTISNMIERPSLPPRTRRNSSVGASNMYASTSTGDHQVTTQTQTRTRSQPPRSSTSNRSLISHQSQDFPTPPSTPESPSNVLLPNRNRAISSFHQIFPRSLGARHDYTRDLDLEEDTSVELLEEYRENLFQQHVFPGTAIRQLVMSYQGDSLDRIMGDIEEFESSVLASDTQEGYSVSPLSSETAWHMTDEENHPTDMLDLEEGDEHPSHQRSLLYPRRKSAQEAFLMNRSNDFFRNPFSSPQVQCQCFCSSIPDGKLWNLKTCVCFKKQLLEYEGSEAVRRPFHVR